MRSIIKSTKHAGKSREIDNGEYYRITDKPPTIIGTHSHPVSHARARANTHTHTHTYTHTHTHTYAHTHARAHIDTQLCAAHIHGLPYVAAMLSDTTQNV